MVSFYASDDPQVLKVFYQYYNTEKSEGGTEHVHFYFIKNSKYLIHSYRVKLKNFFPEFSLFSELSLTLEALFTDIVALASHLLLQICIILFNNLLYCVYYI